MREPIKSPTKYIVPDNATFKNKQFSYPLGSTNTFLIPMKILKKGLFDG